MPESIPSLEMIRAERARRETERARAEGEAAACESLAAFVRQAWAVLHPTTPLVWGWHIDAVCLHLQAVFPREQIRRLLINIPPGHMKSLAVAVFWPAWVWLHDPSYSFIFGSYDSGLSTRDSIRCRDVMTSRWYQETFRPAWRLKHDQNVKTWFENTAGGFRISTSVGGKGTGHRADCLVFDDPLNVEEYPSAEKLAGNKSWWDHRMSTRAKDPRTGSRIGIMQRIHEDDLAGHCIAKGSYELLRLPTEFDPDKPCRTGIGWTDPRTERGELLNPEMYTEDVITEAKDDLGSAGFAAQHNQEPAPAGGLMFHRQWFGFWWTGVEPKPVMVRLEDGTVVECKQMELPAKMDTTATSSDFSFGSKSSGASRVSIQVWAALRALRFLLAEVSDKMTYPEMKRALISVIMLHPMARKHYVENKALGPAIIQELTEEIAGIEPVEPMGDKVARAASVTPICESGHVYLPHPSVHPWVNEWLHLVTMFPRAKYNDPVDACTQALTKMRRDLRNLDRLRALAKRG